MKSTIRLFKAVIVKDIPARVEKSTVESFLKETVQFGFILAPEIIASYDAAGVEAIIAEVKDEIGLSPTQMNSSFHKSWHKVETAKICQLVLEQILHYVTTYGFERLGIYDKDSVYIPKEELAIPKLEDDLPLAVIKGYTRAEMMDKLMSLLSAGIALKGETVKDVVSVAVYLDIDETRIASIKNKEVMAMLYDYLDKIPIDPVEFLRLAIYKSTNTTMLIKNDSLITLIKANDNLRLAKMFGQYDDDHGFKKLSSIFNRFKPLFLAFKTNDTMKHYINQIAKLSKNHHVPMPEDYLNQVTAKLSKGTNIDPAELLTNLTRANIFRKARLAYALKFRSEDPTSIMYKVRNGKAFSTNFSFPEREIVEIEPVLDIVIDSIVADLKGISGKKIYIPENVVYSMPATEKQFTGDIPSGSFVEINNDMIVGIHWQNVEGKRIDLDLKMTGVDTETGEETMIGWDARYRKGDGSILFSGDVTDAPGEGASELFYIKTKQAGVYILSVNSFNQDKDTKIPFSIFVAKERIKKLESNYMVDPNSIVCKSKTKIDTPQKVMGMVLIKDGTCRFYFSETQIGNSRTMSFESEYARHALRYFVSFFSAPISLNNLLKQAGATIVSNKAERQNCDVDLSPESVTKDSFLKLISMARPTKNAADAPAGPTGKEPGEV